MQNIFKQARLLTHSLPLPAIIYYIYPIYIIYILNIIYTFRMAFVNDDHEVRWSLISDTICKADAENALINIEKNNIYITCPSA